MDLGKFTVIHENISNYPDLVVGNFCEIGEGCIIGPSVILQSHVRVGKNVMIGEGVIIKFGSSLTEGMVVEHDVFIGPNVVFLGSDHNRKSIHGTRIGARSFIGAGVNVAAGITIGCDVIVGANSFVSRDLLLPGIYVGCPAKKNKG